MECCQYCQGKGTIGFEICYNCDGDGEKEKTHDCPFCNDDEKCPGKHELLDTINMTDEELAEEGLQRIYNSKEYCKQRIWDNGDMTDCGKKIYALQLCQKHFLQHKTELEEHKKELIKELEKTNKLLEETKSL
jgi:ribosomal protein L16 Arg81 hydroxylase